MDFVTFKLAKKLKEKGFDYPCIAHYDINEKLKVVIREPIFWHSDVLSYTDAPTISQVLKWLRKEKKIHICVDFDGDMNWYYQIAIYGSTDIAADGYGYNDYELSALAGIECVLDNFI